MFAKLAVKNIKRSIKDYAIYFFTLVLGVAVFYVFNALDSQTVMMDVSERVADMLDLMNVILGVVSVFVSFILGALIIYASRFLIKRRGKEFGIYLTLGMSKRKISLILLIETFLIGLISLITGLLLGIIASQLTSIVVANMFAADLTNFHFVFSTTAFIKTLIYFGIIYLIVMIFNTIIISRQKLINLLSSNRRNEKVKLKNPWVCTIVFLCASVLLAWAYYLVTAGLMDFVDHFEDVGALLIPIIMGVVATFLLFWSLSGLLLRIFMSFKQVYYNKLNSFVLRQFSSKINTTVISMSLICLMLFVTICVLGSALSISHTMNAAIDAAMPVDVQVTSIGTDATPIEEIYRREGIDLDDLLKDTVSYRRYVLEDFHIADTIGEEVMSQATNQEKQTINEVRNTSEYFINLSDYNRAAKVFNLPELALDKNEYAVLANFKPIMELRNQAMSAGKQIKVLGRTLSPHSTECIQGDIELESMNLNPGIIIVPDDIQFAKVNNSYVREFLVGNYREPTQGYEIEKQLERIDNRFFSEDSSDDEDVAGSAIYGPADDDSTYVEVENTGNSSSTSHTVNTRPVYYYYNVTTKQYIIDNSVGTSALITFIGLYLGIIFLISSAAVLALKELSESSDNRDKYTILRKLGASNSMLSRALFWQIFIFFVFPLLIAILHSIFGLMFCDFVLSSLGGIDITHALPWVSGILLLIYGGYFMITYLCSRNIIREHRL